MRLATEYFFEKIVFKLSTIGMNERSAYIKSLTILKLAPGSTFLNLNLKKTIQSVYSIATNRRASIAAKNLVRGISAYSDL